LDIVEPTGVVAHRVDAQADDLGVAPVEVRLESRHIAQLRRAHGREVLRVREQDRPFVADPLVKMDRALGRLGGEIGGFVAYADRHTRTSFPACADEAPDLDRKSTRLNSSHVAISYAVFCLKKKRALRAECSSPPRAHTFQAV